MFTALTLPLRLLLALLSPFAVSPLATTQATPPGPDAHAYRQAVESWRADREASLRADDGWLTLVGLHWLRTGENRVGGLPTADIPRGSYQWQVRPWSAPTGTRPWSPASSFTIP
jgi:hypothetical protein